MYNRSITSRTARVIVRAADLASNQMHHMLSVVLLYLTPHQLHQMRQLLLGEGGREGEREGNRVRKRRRGKTGKRNKHKTACVIHTCMFSFIRDAHPLLTGSSLSIKQATTPLMAVHRPQHCMAITVWQALKEAQEQAHL